MQASAAQCSMCGRAIGDADAAFCPSCSCVVIDHSLLNSKSTANYDPTSREWKPWQDKALVPKRDYKYSSKKPKPWLPTMRVQTRRIPKDGGAPAPKVPVTLSESSASEHVAQEATQAEAEPDGAEPSPRLYPSPTAVDINSTEEGDGVARIEDKKGGIIREVVYPLAAYEVSVQDAQTIVMIVSLIEQLHGAAGTVRVYWSRISYATEDERESSPGLSKPSSPAQESSYSQDLGQQRDTTPLAPLQDQQIVFLSNSQAKLFSPYEDWLDFDKIDADQFYVAQHMQGALQFLANRMTIVRKFEGVILFHEIPVDTTSVATFAAHVTVEQRQSSWTALSYGTTHSSASSKIMMRCRRTVTETRVLRTSLVFDECIAEQPGRVKIARINSTVFLPVVVHSFVLYADRYDSTVPKSGKFSKSQLRQSNRASHLRVCLAPAHVQQVVSLGPELFPSLDMTLDGAALSLLMPSGGDLEDVLQACEGSVALWRQYVDRLLTLLRVEWTAEHGVSFTLVGAFCDPVCTSQPWPDGMVNEEVVEADGGD